MKESVDASLPCAGARAAGCLLHALNLEPVPWSSTVTPSASPVDTTRTRYAFVHAQWHAPIVHQARDAYCAAMHKLGVSADDIDVVEVPGAFEIPLMARRLARSGRYAAITGCAFVVDGGIYRHEFVADTVVGALMTVQLETDVPVLSVVLTPHHFHAGDEHQAFFASHFLVKGAEAAHACVQTVQALRRWAPAP
jgi:6,7-dimethyl-8-ribityllumazine synthase